MSTLRVPDGPSLNGIVGNAHVLWRLARQRKGAEVAARAGDPAEEYKCVCDFMRLYATLRFYQLALLLGTTGSIVTALCSVAARLTFAQAEVLKTGGVLISLAFLVMEFRASSYWHFLRDRGNELATALRYETFPVASRWNPLTTTGASFYLHVLVAGLWLSSLFLEPAY
jgi:hypothetical protein